MIDDIAGQLAERGDQQRRRPAEPSTERRLVRIDLETVEDSLVREAVANYQPLSTILRKPLLPTRDNSCKKRTEGCFVEP